MVRVSVGVDARAYEVSIGDGALDGLKEAVERLGASRAAVVTQAGIAHDVHTGLAQDVLFMDSGEQAKTLATVEDLCRGFAKLGLTRRDVVVSVGGGVVTDTAGFAAASYHRGTPVIHVPTTLLAQVDAAIGGKTGVNLPEGKNLVGAFWQPEAVICDTSLLASLPEREWLSGLGEVAKCQLLGAPVTAGSPNEDMVAACVRLKADVVAADEHETSGRRELLNYGHTLAHALETLGEYDLRHGEAVAIGLSFAAHLARRLDRISEERQQWILSVVRGYGLGVRSPGWLDTISALEVMRRDKKSRDGMRFVLDGPDGVEPVSVPDAEVRDALEQFVRLAA